MQQVFSRFCGRSANTGIVSAALTVGRSRFTMPSSREPLALRAIRTARRPAFAIVDGLADAKTFKEVMSLLGWGLRRNSRGEIRGLFWIGEKGRGAEESLFELIAPFVDAGSFIEIRCDAYYPVSIFEFDGKRCRRSRVSAIGPTQDVLLQDDEAALTPAWQNITDLIPPLEERYYFSQEARYEAGQWIEHEQFGPGLVTSSTPHRIRVVFADGPRSLAHAC